ncbi:hypothetical protein GOARA_050_00450 [Gordonia araii NBRC 100433]|uniref:Uncharacterized protein n=1 Tax=Gordonia araii NBRC 100433 TaxID=1073574 RepID=G7H2A8_9ACTN|nr:hypothetical protein [Gordonia araii]NNG97522.1 hypothetical protein [Gordonia araii NBRC 100433]GAB09983.1 hypothetical protein GOARA_050_00450 [Gordonia araii NBRC 100433]
MDGTQGFRETDTAARWAGFTAWLATRLAELPVACVIDAGRADASMETHGYDVECAQMQRLHGGRILLRLSTTLMVIPLLDTYDGDVMEADRWHHDDLFEDCTHGYLVSSSPALVADLVTGWFRERCGFAEPDQIGFAYMSAKSLPRTADAGGADTAWARAAVADDE